MDVETGEYALTVSDETFLPQENATLTVGISAITLHGENLYYLNISKQLFERVAINTNLGKTTGASKVTGTGFMVDDLRLTSAAKQRMLLC